MTEAKQSPYAPRVISEGDIPVHKSLGEVAQTAVWAYRARCRGL
jgi:hypothetical protein